MSILYIIYYIALLPQPALRMLDVRRLGFWSVFGLYSVCSDVSFTYVATTEKPTCIHV